MTDIQTATEMARKKYLPMNGIIAVSNDGYNIIFYVEKEEDARRVPASFMGYRCIAMVIGKLMKL
jgi:hypothetical protein